MHTSTVLAVLATVANAAFAPAYDPTSSISSVEQAATVSAPVYDPTSSVSSEEQAATLSAPAYDPTSSISSAEASATAPLYPTLGSQNAGFNFTVSASGSTSCTESTNGPATSGTIVTIPTNVPAASTTIITLEHGTVVTTVYVPSATSQPAAGSDAPSYHDTAAPSNGSPVDDSTQTQEQDAQIPAACIASTATVTVTNTQTITVKQTGDAPSAAPISDAPTPDDAQPTVESPAPSAAPTAAPTDDGSELQPSIITLEQSASVAPSTEEADATVPAAYSTATEEADATVPAGYSTATEEADATVPAYSTQEADATVPVSSANAATLTVLPLAGAASKSISYQNASASTTKAYTGPSYEGGASSYGVTGLTLVGALALVLAL
ncbi:unnamed protein product [Zymoseptoria tritici ST99CH_1A5]|uniref:Uncharacterized protein n=1 Tax=Zymoseptoria tritici ST99CH_1A5 TaxID=1276529 RepID=A0A1Y6LEF3_ZYMTR|nr:unnamed protein product [Zymoseptoria tritici ST99CH_1A5]